VPTATLARFRTRYPILRHRVYVNSCSQGALSIDVEAALGAFIESWHTRGSPWDRWVEEVERLRGLFAAAIGAEDDEVGVMPNASMAIAAIATALPFGGARGRGFEVATPDTPANRGPLVVVRSTDAASLARRLEGRGIIASARGTGLRVSFHAYNTEEDVDAVLAGLDIEEALVCRRAN